MGGINIADRVLILGGSYFVGRKLVEYLTDHGYAVTVLNRGTRPLSVEGVEQICCDRNDGEGMKAALAGMVFDYDNVLAVSKINAII